MGLEIQEREREGITILDLSGQIIAGEEAGQFRSSMQNVAQAGRNRMVWNLAGVDYIDSTGLGAIVMAATTIRKGGGDVKLLNLTQRTIELLVMTKLATIFDTFLDETEAVNSFFPDRKIQKFDILDFVRRQSHD